MEPATRIKLPRLYVFIILIVVLFSAVNLYVLYYGKNVLAAIYQIDAWVGVILLGLIGSMLIGMYAAYRLFTLRAFTPFEREMMEMRVEVAEIKRTVDAVAAKVDGIAAPGCGERDGDLSGGTVVPRSGPSDGKE